MPVSRIESPKEKIAENVLFAWAPMVQKKRQAQAWSMKNINEDAETIFTNSECWVFLVMNALVSHGLNEVWSVCIYTLTDRLINKQLMVRHWNYRSERNLISKFDLKLISIVVNRNKSFL